MRRFFRGGGLRVGGHVTENSPKGYKFWTERDTGGIALHEILYPPLKEQPAPCVIRAFFDFRFYFLDLDLLLLQ